MKARPYQAECRDALMRYFATHTEPTKNPVCALPTGTGKAFCLADFMHYALTNWPGQRIMNLVHVRELVEQNAATMRRIWPQAPLGVFSAGLGQKVAHMPITFAGIKSVANNLNLFGRQDIIIIDECHLVSENEESDYRKVMNYFRALNPHLRVIGFSATPYRVGLGMITDGTLFSDVAYDITGLAAFNNLIEEGYLAPLIPIQTKTILSVAGVGKTGGDFASGQLQAAVNREDLTRAALTETVKAAADRAHWLIFGAGVDHVQAIATMLNQEFGVPTAVVHGKLPVAERDAAIQAFKNGEVRALANANCLTTGFDFPALDCIVCLRPTNSVVLHIQMLGRGTRPFYAPGFDLETTQGRLDAILHSPKRNTLVLDFAGNVTRCGPVNDPRIPKDKGKGKGEMPVKLCDYCSCLNHISARKCDNCGEEFTIEEKITEQASTAVIVAQADPPRIERFPVGHITLEKHSRPGIIDCLKVSYYCGVQRFTEYVLLEHKHSPIWHKAEKWWRDRSHAVVPESIGAAISLEYTLAKPTHIDVWVNKKKGGKLAPEIWGHVFPSSTTL